VRVWEARTGQVIETLPSKRGSISFNPQGSLLALCESVDDGSRAVFVWNTTTWDRVAELKGPPGRFENIRFSPDGQLLAVGTDLRFDLWKAQTFERAGSIDAGCYYWFAFSADGKSILAAATHEANKTHMFKQWDVKTGAKRGEFEVRFLSSALLMPVLSADGRALYIPNSLAKRGESSRQVRVLDAATGEELLPAAAGNEGQ
jgi:WD40 repeat protein